MPQSVRPMEIRSDGSFALRAHPESWTDAKALGVAGAEAVAVPTGAKYVIFGATIDFYARFNATAAGTAAAIPTDTADGTACICNPTHRYLGTDVAEISLISNGTAGVVTLEFYR